MTCPKEKASSAELPPVSLLATQVRDGGRTALFLVMLYSSVQLQKANAPRGAQAAYHLGALTGGAVQPPPHPRLNLEPLLCCPVSRCRPAEVRGRCQEPSSSTVPSVQVSRLHFVPEKPPSILGPGWRWGVPARKWDASVCGPQTWVFKNVLECRGSALTSPHISGFSGSGWSWGSAGDPWRDRLQPPWPWVSSASAHTPTSHSRLEQRTPSSLRPAFLLPQMFLAGCSWVLPPSQVLLTLATGDQPGREGGYSQLACGCAPPAFCPLLTATSVPGPGLGPQFDQEVYGLSPVCPPSFNGNQPRLRAGACRPAGLGT